MAQRYLMYIEHQYFEHLAKYQVAVCRECRYAVWPDQIKGHLQKQHKQLHRRAKAVGDALEIPSNGVQPIPQLPVWSAGKKRGRPSRIREKDVQAEVDEGCKPVHCQRLFGSRHGSQYFEVHHVQDHSPQPVPTEGEAAWARVGEEMAEAWAHLDRTGWLPYLIDVKRPDLLASIEEPNVDPDKDDEPVEAAIWNAMDGLARVSQASVVKRTGIFVRMEAIRTKMHQTRYTPLQAYMDNTSIKERSRPWKQMLMFFARTQREHS
ncbi:hypothetical protein IQ07DRAFT_616828 [Pyrenochaeta sp. DS3sAY3a]|nr:hypothetical protein IQ07DRAFT_616828 [Pyrenochaeta sp. DS3sAY3a]